MNHFSYSKADTVGEAIKEITSRNSAQFIAGGTNILDLMKENVSRPQHLIDINHLPLNSIEENESGGLRLGALRTNADTAYHPLVEEKYPLLAKAILAGASPQLRNMATNGGNILQRTRCYYFYDTATGCNKRKPGSGCSAINGFNRIHAILGASESCIATHPSDLCIALAALDATINVSGPEGERVIPFEDFHRLPGNTPHMDNNLLPGEIITSIDLPKKGFPTNYTYIKLRDRQSYAFALVSVAAALELEEGKIKDARIALGGVAHKPWRNKEAERLLLGKRAEKESFALFAEEILKEAKGYQYNSFKIELARRAVVRALTEAVG